MTEEAADISQFCELSCYEWVMYMPGVIDCHKEPLHLGKYLGPAIDIAPAMTTKIVQSNGEVVYHKQYKTSKLCFPGLQPSLL